MPPRKKITHKTTVDREKEIKKSSYTYRLYRSTTDRIFGGVAGGLGEYFGIDPLLFRIIFIALTIFGGGGILLYLLLWIIIPAEGNTSQINEESIRGNVDEMRGQVKQWAHHIGSTPKDSARSWLGIILVIGGIYFLLHNLGIVYNFPISKLWPIALVLIGISIFIK